MNSCLQLTSVGEKERERERKIGPILLHVDNLSSHTTTLPSNASSEPVKFFLLPIKIFCHVITFFVARKGKYNEAIQLLNKALEEEKKKAGLYINRGGS